MINQLVSDALAYLKELSKLDTNYIRKTLNRASFLENFFESNKIPFEEYNFYTPVPDWVEYYLIADGEQINALPNGLKSGEIEKNLKDSSDLENEYNYANINFNSRLKSDVDISTPVFYNAPALAIAKRDVAKVLNAKEVEGYLEVKIRNVRNKNFIVGDLEKAKLYVIIHYDALWVGAIDNTSSLSAFLSLLKNKALDLDKIAIFFIGFTEVTNYWPEYWDYSFQRVYQKYEDYFNNVDKILIVDCIGYRNTQLLRDEEYIEAYKTFGGKDKLLIYGTPLEDLYEIYHATNDTFDKISKTEMTKSISEILSYL